MIKGLGLGASLVALTAMPAWAQTGLFLTYPPDGHETTATQIFLIGTGDGPVTINGQAIRQSPAGHFAPSFPLQLGTNRFTLRQGSQEQTVTITRQPLEAPLNGVSFGALEPAQNMSRQPGELICLGAVAPPNATVTARLGGQILTLTPQPPTASLPPNNAILTDQNAPNPERHSRYQGCFTATEPGDLGTPTFTLSLGRERVEAQGGSIAILSPQELEVIEVTAPQGVARTGPNTNHSRLTPLPRGTRATVTGREGDWLRLEYGAWINGAETRSLPGAVPPLARIRSVSGRPGPNGIEMAFPLTVPVPVTIEQEDERLRLTLHGAIAETDTIRLDDDPLIRRLDWQQVNPNTLTYTFHLKTPHQWGYDFRYDGSTLRLLLRYPPELRGELNGLRVVLDPGHGGAELGARGPNGYPEKEINLILSQKLRRELERRGAQVYLTRETDVDLGLRERMDFIAQVQPHVALSVHYNALPDSGNAEETAGIGMFWYHPQAHDLAVFLQESLVANLDRPHYGVFWNNLALTRPHAAPTVLMELGFMINPWEFEWITDEAAQDQLAGAIASALTQWVQTRQAVTVP